MYASISSVQAGTFDVSRRLVSVTSLHDWAVVKLLLDFGPPRLNNARTEPHSTEAHMSPINLSTEQRLDSSLL